MCFFTCHYLIELWGGDLVTTVSVRGKGNLWVLSPFYLCSITKQHRIENRSRMRSLFPMWVTTTCIHHCTLALMCKAFYILPDFKWHAHVWLKDPHVQALKMDRWKYIKVMWLYGVFGSHCCANSFCPLQEALVNIPCGTHGTCRGCSRARAPLSKSFCLY